MKRTVKIVVCLFVAVLAFFTFAGLEIYSKNFKDNTDIIEAVKEEPSVLKCNGVKSKASMTEDEVAKTVKDLFYDAINMNKYFIMRVFEKIISSFYFYKSGQMLTSQN